MMALIDRLAALGAGLFLLIALACLVGLVGLVAGARAPARPVRVNTCQLARSVAAGGRGVVA